MANTRALVKRRKAIRNIRKITRTMELIATARFKKALDRAVEAEAYTRKIAELAADLSANAGDLRHPLLEQRETVRSEVLLVLTSNRGLCGGYNAAILREAGAQLRRDQTDGVAVHLEVSGRRGIAYYRYQGVAAEQTYTQFEDRPRYDDVETIANRYLADYAGRRIDRVSVAYMKFLNAARQVPVVETLLPMTTLAPATRDRPAAETQPSATPQAAAKVEYEFLPGAASILEQILPESFKIRLFKCFLDSAVSEQIARRVAMKAATENAGDMIKELSREYNRARQAQITKEIAEIIGGAAAMEKASMQAPAGIDLAREHLLALRIGSEVTRWFRAEREPQVVDVTPERVIDVLNRVGVNPVLMGTHGINVYRDEPRATQDVDVLVTKKNVRRAVRALETAFPYLEVVENSAVARFLDPVTQKVVLDVMKPSSQAMQSVFRHTVVIRDTHRIPTLEMALVSKFVAMTAPARRDEKKLIDMGDFTNIVKQNRAALDLEKLKQLGDKVCSGGGARILELVADIDAGRLIRI